MVPRYSSLTQSNCVFEQADEPHHQAHERRDSFRRWLDTHRTLVKRMSLPDILSSYGGTISLPAAYRIAVSAGVRGKRRNASRYDPFWDTINWRLPDSTLSTVWTVTRGNIRQRRVRLRVAAAAYAIHSDRLNPRFQQELACEKRRAKNFSEPTPR